MAGVISVDTDLLEALRAGQAAAWEEVYRRHETTLYSFVVHRARGDRSLADDVFQDTLLRAVERIERFDPERGSFGAWLSGIARNELRQRLRRQRSLDLRRALRPQVTKDEALREQINLSVTRLPWRQQRALQLKYQEGWSLEEIAAELETTPAAIGSLLHRARAAFREAYAALDQGGQP